MKPDRWIAVLLLFLPACAAEMRQTWFEATELRKTAAAEADRESDAVVLHEALFIATRAGRSEAAFTERIVHKAVLIRSEAGLAQADMRISRGADQRLIVRARTLAPDGSIRELQQKDLIETSATIDKDSQLKVSVFRLPNVDVGSILEVIYAIESEYNLGSTWDFIADESPVRHYHAEIVLPTSARFAATVYSLPTSFRKVDGDPLRLVLDVHDIAANPQEQWMPPPMFYRPFWRLRMTAYEFHRNTWTMDRDWSAILSPLAHRLYVDNAKLLAGDVPKFAAKRTQDEVIDALFKRIRDDVRLTGFDNWQAITPRGELFKQKSGDAADKAFALWAYLHEAGIDARFAATTWIGGQFFDAEQPNLNWLNHLIVYVPSPKGGGRWLDPSCEMCEPGEIPYWLEGAMAVIFTVEIRSEGTVAVTNALRVTGTVRKETLRQATTEVYLNGLGYADMEVRQTYTGADAMTQMRQTRNLSHGAQSKEAEQQMRLRDEKALPDLLGDMQCDVKLLKCTRKWTFHSENAAAVVGQRLLLPLRLIGSHLNGLFVLDDPRRTPILVADPIHEVEVLAVALPPGLTVMEEPADVTIREHDFGMACRAGWDGKFWTLTRELTIPAGVYPVAKYAGLRKVIRAFVGCSQGNLVASKVK